MTGMEAWSIVAPILAAHMVNRGGALNALDEAYITVFGALNKLDDADKSGHGESAGGSKHGKR